MAKTIREFPGVVSITITNKCNLRCNMCAQWSREGYIRNGQCDFSHSGKMAPYECLTRSIDEISKYGAMLILRGGEPLLYPKIIDIIRYAKNKKVTVSLETNAVLLKQFAKDLVGLRLDDLRISVDGPEKVHDSVRGVKGTFSRMRNSLGVLLQEEEKQGFEISRSMACTISDLNYQTIGQMPEVARALGFRTLCIIPYYFISNETGKAYEKNLAERFSCRAYSWKGFHREQSGVDVDLFLKQVRMYKANIGELKDDPYMDFSDDEYREWFTKDNTTVRWSGCGNVNGLLDIQPDGNVNFCVDFPDYVIGNIETSSLYDIWHSERAEAFRKLRSEGEMPICYRCGNKYMGSMPDESGIREA